MDVKKNMYDTQYNINIENGVDRKKYECRDTCIINIDNLFCTTKILVCTHTHELMSQHTHTQPHEHVNFKIYSDTFSYVHW